MFKLIESKTFSIFNISLLNTGFSTKLGIDNNDDFPSLIINSFASFNITFCSLILLDTTSTSESSFEYKTLSITSSSSINDKVSITWNNP